jgi:hypothetical protein
VLLSNDSLPREAFSTMVTLFNFLRPPAFTPGHISRVPLFMLVKLVCASKKLHSNEKKRALKKMIVIVAKEKLGVFNLAENGTIYGYQNMGVYFSF